MRRYRFITLKHVLQYLSEMRLCNHSTNLSDLLPENYIYPYGGKRGGDTMKIQILDTSPGMIEGLANPGIVIILAAPPGLFTC